MSAKEGDVIEPVNPAVYQEMENDGYILTNIVDNLEREQCVLVEIEMLKRESGDCRKASNWRTDQIEEYLELIRWNTTEIFRLKRVIDGIKRRRVKYVR